MIKFLPLSLLCLAVCWAAPQNSATTRSPLAAHPNNNIYFVVSAKGIDGSASDIDGLADPFVKVFLGTEPSNGQTSNLTDLEPIGVSETVENDNNPVWNVAFNVRHIRGTKQLLYLEVRDDDPVNPDDALGDAYIKLDDLVTNGAYTKVLEKAKSGSVTVTTTTPIYFDLIVKDVPSKDGWFGGLSDPYVKSYFRVGKEGKDYKFHQTEAVDNAETASWESVMFPNFQRGTNQILHFRVKDYDTMSSDDDLGEAFLEVDPFVTANRPVTFNLPEGASLVVTPKRHV